MSDPTKRPLQFPTWHIPYLEKHRIYELFHELARELVIQKPEDHVLFTKQIISNAAKSRDVARVIMLPSPRVNLEEISKEIANTTNQFIITPIILQKCLGRDLLTVPSEMVAKCLAYLVRTENAYNQGWIIVDCIRNEDDAKNLLQLGIIPTHTIHFIAPFHPNLTDLLYCKVRPNWPEMRRIISGLRDIFKSSLREVYLEHRQVLEVAASCVELLKIRKTLKPIVPRVIIVGPRGSGRKTQAKLISSSLNIVHVDFEYLICQSWISSTDIGEKLRNCRNEVCFHSELLSQVINERILQEDCLRRGWVLTGYPYTDTDFKYLDSLDTPPNRVIFLECDLNVCRERIRYRKINAFTGSMTNIRNDLRDNHEKVLKTHPKDDISMIDAELDYYCQNYGPIRKYCGGTASVVNGDQNERWVYECILGIIMRAPPAAPSRKSLTDLDSSSSGTSVGCSCLEVPSKVIDCYIQKM
ncbi:adenylate kinase 8 [Leptinotarsa decemlineata]|uniref:adenylate kinase 8 n=1 Tax=Leptinotarsa decemlineata TaxID=7539 RepID=UPI003D30A166